MTDNAWDRAPRGIWSVSGDISQDQYERDVVVLGGLTPSDGDSIVGPSGLSWEYGAVQHPADNAWDHAMSDPQFRASLAEGLADVAAGRLTPYETWASTVSPFRCAAVKVRGWGFLASGSWRSGYPFAALTLYTPWRTFRPFMVDRRPRA